MNLIFLGYHDVQGGASVTRCCFSFSWNFGVWLWYLFCGIVAVKWVLFKVCEGFNLSIWSFSMSYSSGLNIGGSVLFSFDFWVEIRSWIFLYIFFIEFLCSIIWKFAFWDSSLTSIGSFYFKWPKSRSIGFFFVAEYIELLYPINIHVIFRTGSILVWLS